MRPAEGPEIPREVGRLLFQKELATTFLDKASYFYSVQDKELPDQPAHILS